MRVRVGLPTPAGLPVQMSRRALAASMSLGGGGDATHLLKNAWRSCFGLSRAISGSCLMAAARSVGKMRNTVEASWGPGEGPGGAPPRRGGIQRGELVCVQNRKVVVQVQDAMWPVTIAGRLLSALHQATRAFSATNAPTNSPRSDWGFALRTPLASSAPTS